MTNKITKYGLMIMAAVLFIAVLGTGAASADTPDGMTGSNWMSFIPDNASIGELNIPGSHDSAVVCTPYGSEFQTQDIDVKEQFKAGVRWFDVEYYMRTTANKKATIDGVYIKDLGDGKDAHVINNEVFYTYDGERDDDALLVFEHIIPRIYEKVAANPTETAIITLKASDYAGDGLEGIIKEEIKDLCKKRPNHFMLVESGKQLPTMGEARGKVIFLFEGTYSKTFKNGDFRDHLWVEEKTTMSGYMQACKANQTSELRKFWTGQETSAHNVQNYSQIHTLNKSKDQAEASPVVVYTNFVTASYQQEDNVMADAISGGEVWDFKQGNYYGAVLFNYVDSDAAKIIYESNSFGGKIDKPVLTTPLTYNGQEQCPVTVSAEIKLSGNYKETDVGTYTFIASPNTDMGYTWSDGTTAPVTYKWEIVPLEVPQPELNETSYQYDGNVHSVKLIPEDSSKYSINSSSSTLSATAVNTYTVTVTLNDKSNTVWATTNSNASLILPWSILPVSVGEMPKLDPNKFVYNGSKITVAVTNSTLFKIEENATAIGVGVYLAKVNVTEGHAWENGYKGSIYLPWVIVPRNITAPALTKDTFVYNNSEQTVSLNPEQSSNYSITKGGSATAAGTYYAVVALKDPKNNSWLVDSKLQSGVKVQTKIPRVYQWSITPYKEIIPELMNSQLGFTGQDQTPVLDPSSGNWTKSGNLTERNASAYKIDVGLIDTVNYTWADATSMNKTLYWSVTPKQVDRPDTKTIQHVFTYTGSEQTLGISSTQHYTLENNSKTEVGVYLAEVELIEPGNRVWSDTLTTETIKVPWMIRKDSVTIYYTVNDSSLGSVSPTSEIIKEGEQASGSIATVNPNSPDTVFLYWNRTVGPLSDESEEYVTLDTKVTPLTLSGASSTDYIPETYTAVFGPNEMNLGKFYISNSSSYVFGIHEGALTTRSNDLVTRISLQSINGVLQGGTDHVYRNDTTATNPPVTSGYTSQVLSIFNVTVQPNETITQKNNGYMTFVVGIQFEDYATAQANADKVVFWHNNDGVWESQPLTNKHVILTYPDGLVRYLVYTKSFSPIAITIETPQTPSPSGGSSSSHSGGTILQTDTTDNMFEVNFNMNGHGSQVTNQSVSFGNTAKEPSPAPTANGYTFNGWYTNKGLTSKYAFSTPVTNDVELYAGWTADIPTAPTAKPTTQSTQSSPAPLAGLIAGLGAVALVYRMRR